MSDFFTSEFFTANRERLRQLFTGTAPIVITANGLLQRGGDTNYKFAQDANFWYLTGIDEPDIILVMDRDKEYLIVTQRSSSRQAFDGALEYTALAQRSGIQTILDSEAGWEQLTSRLKKVRHISTIAAPAAYVEHFGLYTNPARATLLQKLKQHNSELEVLDLGPHLSRLRMIKQPPELVAIQVAMDITTKTLRDALGPRKLRSYTHEYQLEAELSRGFRQQGASGHAFEPIVASGSRACTLHYVANSGRFSADELVVVDVGAEIDHYAADITRTISLSTPSRRQQTVHRAVLEVQEFALTRLTPGTLLKSYEQDIEQFMGEKLRELGLIKTISRDSVRTFFPHATSHFLGLNPHDVGDYERPLEAGVVLTVEPGIYIPKEGIGVRIEDDVLITPTGNKVLSGNLSRALV